MSYPLHQANRSHYFPESRLRKPGNVPSILKAKGHDHRHSPVFVFRRHADHRKLVFTDAAPLVALAIRRGNAGQRKYMAALPDRSSDFSSHPGAKRHRRTSRSPQPVPAPLHPRILPKRNDWPLSPFERKCRPGLSAIWSDSPASSGPFWPCSTSPETHRPGSRHARPGLVPGQ